MYREKYQILEKKYENLQSKVESFTPSSVKPTLNQANEPKSNAELPAGGLTNNESKNKKFKLTITADENDFTIAKLRNCTDFGAKNENDKKDDSQSGNKLQLFERENSDINKCSMQDEELNMSRLQSLCSLRSRSVSSKPELDQ